jgi:glycosyltransferase involved in cell wall biosynthesis
MDCEVFGPDSGHADPVWGMPIIGSAAKEKITVLACGPSTGAYSTSDANPLMNEPHLSLTSSRGAASCNVQPRRDSLTGEGWQILMVAPQPFFRIRGTPFSILHRIRALTAYGHQVDLITYPFGDDVPIKGLRIIRAQRPPGIRDVKIGPSIAKLILDLPLYSETIRALRARRYDVLHSHEEAAFFAVSLARRFGLPHIYDMHSSLPQQLSNFKTYDLWPVRALFERLERWVLRSCAGVITICPELAEIAASECPSTPHAMIENTADNTQVFSSPGGNVRAELGLHGRAVILYTGTLEPYQGVDLLLHGFAQIRPRHEQAHLLIVGGASEQIERYRQMASGLALGEAVTFTGQVHPGRIADFLAAADVIVSPRSRGPNTPLKIYDYLRSGRPLVATALRTHTQILDPEVACLVPPSAAGLAAGIHRVLGDRAFGERLARAAAKRAAERFSDADYIARVRDFYDRVMERQRVAVHGSQRPAVELSSQL